MSKLVTRKNIKKFLLNYDIGKLIECRLIPEGNINEVVFIKTEKGKYILKIATANSPHKVKYEVELLNYFRSPVTPSPVLNKRNSYLSDYDSYKAFIYQFLEGSHKY